MSVRVMMWTNVNYLIRVNMNAQIHLDLITVSVKVDISYLESLIAEVSPCISSNQSDIQAKTVACRYRYR
jgi:hypothetical protein